MEWALTEVDDDPIYLGKWGHRMLPWTKDNEPALYFIAGDAVGDGSFVSDVFVNTETCETITYTTLGCRRKISLTSKCIERGKRKVIYMKVVLTPF